MAALGFITLNYLQITTTLCSANIQLPVSISSVSGFWSFTVDPSAAFDMECIGMSDFRSRTITKALGPPAVVLASVSIYLASVLVASLRRRPELVLQRNQVINVGGSIMFSFFNAIASMSLFIFKCAGNPNGKQTLVGDASVICFESDEWASVLGIVIGCLLVYVVGLGGVLVRTLWVAPAYFADSGFQMRWKFLFIKFHAAAYWWGIVYLAKNLFVTMAFVVAYSGIAQIYFALVVILAYHASATLVMPYRWLSANLFQIVSAMGILYFSSLLICFSDKSSPELQNNVVNAAVAIHVIPFGALAVLGICTVLYGRRPTPLPAEKTQAGQIFQQFRQSALLLADIDFTSGAEFWLHMGDWEWHHLLTTSRVLRVNLLGVQERILSDFKFSNQFRANLPPQSPLRRSIQATLPAPAPEMPWITSKVSHVVL